MTRLQRVLGARLGGRVERAHGVPHQGSYSNAMHQWGVAMLLWELWPERFADLASHALTHDIAEAWVGDIPASVKVLDPVISQRLQRVEDLVLDGLGLPCHVDLTESDRDILRACDQLELFLWALDQVAGGNGYAVDVVKNLRRHWLDRPLPEPAATLAADAWEQRAGQMTQVDILDMRDLI